MQPNLLVTLGAALIPMIIGFVWYHPKVLGNTWMDAAGLNEEKIKGGNMPLIFGISFVLSFFIAFSLFFATVHQAGFFSLMITETGFGEAGSEIQTYIDDFMSRFGTKHRSFGHGAFHGGLIGLGLAFPILATNALFERKSWKYIWVNSGYWMITFILMGGIMAAFG